MRCFALDSRDQRVFHLIRSGERSPGKAQHLGLGRRLVERAARVAAEAGYRDLAVISAVGTRDYYRALGFRDRGLYQYRSLEKEASDLAPSS